jgi:hypothetical protein
MRSAAECIFKAQELSEFAETLFNPDARALVLTMAELWLELSAQAQLQDSCAPARTHRVP